MWQSLAFAVLLIGYFSSALGAQFVVAANPQAPFKFEHQGQPKGIDVEVMQTVLNELGIKHTFKFINVDVRLLEEAKAGRVDMLMLYSKKPAREVFLTYPIESYVSLDWHFFVRKTDLHRFQFDRFSDLKNYRIGMTSGVSYPQALLESGALLDYASSTSIQIKKLLAKRIDLAPMSTKITLFGLTESERSQLTYLPKPLKSKPYYNVFAKASVHPGRQKVLDAYDGIVKRMKSDGRLLNIYRRYLGEGYQAQF